MTSGVALDTSCLHTDLLLQLTECRVDEVTIIARTVSLRFCVRAV